MREIHFVIPIKFECATHFFSFFSFIYTSLSLWSMLYTTSKSLISDSKKQPRSTLYTFMMATIHCSRCSGNALCIIMNTIHAVKDYCIAQSVLSSTNEYTPPIASEKHTPPQESNLNKMSHNQCTQQNKFSSPKPAEESSPRTSTEVPTIKGLTFEAQDQTSDSEEEDYYYPSSNDEADTSNDSEDEGFERAVSYSVDLVSQENVINKTPVFTRPLLESLKTQVDQIKQEFSLPPSQRTLDKLLAPGPQGKSHKIWDSCGENNANSISVHYFPRIELDPNFQHAYGSHMAQIQLMRGYNRSRGEEEHFTFPYAINTYKRLFSNEHHSNEKMKTYWHSLLRTRELWMASSSRHLICELFTGLAKTHAPVTKVVCFGLGAINMGKEYYESSVQYMAMFTIIAALQNEYKKTDPERAGIKLLLQDPNYEIRDYQLIQKLWPGNQEDLVFVSDPDGLLAIDSSTIVVSVYLPIQVPLVQIIADLFHNQPGSGPAMVIGDDMVLDPAKSFYSLSERAAPHVARFFDQQYEKLDSGFGDYGLEEEFMEQVLGENWMERGRCYWLNNMGLWARKVHGTE